MPIPSDPPEPKFNWPRSWWMWLMDMLLWAKSKQPIPSTNDFAVSETPQGIRFALRDENTLLRITNSLRPFALLNAGTDWRVRAGVISGMVPTGMDLMEDGTLAHPFYLISGASNDDWVWIDCTVSYDGYSWSLDSLVPDYGAAVPAASDTHAYFPLGQIGMSGGFATTAAQAYYGNPWWVRSSNDTGYTDAFLQSPS